MFFSGLTNNDNKKILRTTALDEQPVRCLLRIRCPWAVVAAMSHIKWVLEETIFPLHNNL